METFLREYHFRLYGTFLIPTVLFLNRKQNDLVRYLGISNSSKTNTFSRGSLIGTGRGGENIMNISKLGQNIANFYRGLSFAEPRSSNW